MASVYEVDAVAACEGNDCNGIGAVYDAVYGSVVAWYSYA